MVRIWPCRVVLPLLFSGLAHAQTWEHYGLAVDRAQAAGELTVAPAWQVPLSDAYVDSMRPLPGGDVLLVTRGGKFEPATVTQFAITIRAWAQRL